MKLCPDSTLKKQTESKAKMWPWLKYYHVHLSKKETPHLFICKFLNYQMEYRQAMGFVGIVKVNYTGQKRFLPTFFKFKLNKRGVSFLRECSAWTSSNLVRPHAGICCTGIYSYRSMFYISKCPIEHPFQKYHTPVQYDFRICNL